MQMKAIANGCKCKLQMQTITNGCKCKLKMQLQMKMKAIENGCKCKLQMQMQMHAAKWYANANEVLVSKEDSPSILCKSNMLLEFELLFEFKMLPEMIIMFSASSIRVDRIVWLDLSHIVSRAFKWKGCRLRRGKGSLCDNFGVSIKDSCIMIVGSGMVRVIGGVITGLGFSDGGNECGGLGSD
uniref:Uncharacterized protein n=1 Tax=Tanacetum cinerariifolium TaxID=118510 RepID=A0A699I1N9_TANCI|nr:hypothetical protein [Tanacetum cinerariifolium]